MKSANRWGKINSVALQLVVIAIAMVPTGASAATDIFIQVPRIPGSSTFKGHDGWIDVLTFSGSAVAPVAPVASSGQPCQFSVVKYVDVASPDLWAATVTGVVFSSPVEIDFLTAGAGEPLLAYEVQLENAEIMSIAETGSTEIGSTLALPTETVTFKAARAVVTFNGQKAGRATPITVTFTC